MIDSGFLGMGLVPLKKVKENSKKKNGQLDRQIKNRVDIVLWRGAGA